MCLDSIRFAVKRGKKPEQVKSVVGGKVVKYKRGYKVFAKVNDTLYSPVRNAKFKTGVWLTDSKIINIDGVYQTGYHIFLNRKAAIYYACSDEIICRVRYQDVVARGKEGCANAVVARSIFIEKEM